MKLTKFATALLIAGMGVSFAASAKVTVFAAASMTDALQQIADQYQTKNQIIPWFSLLLRLLLLLNKLKKVRQPIYLFQLAING